MEQRFFPGRQAGKQLAIINGQQPELFHGFQHFRNQWNDFAGRQQAGIQTIVLGQTHRAFQQMTFALPVTCPEKGLPVDTFHRLTKPGNSGAIGARVEIIQGIALAKLQGQGKLRTHGINASSNAIGGRPPPDPGRRATGETVPAGCVAARHWH